jgi:DnaJ like chaperone protein
MRWLGKLLGVLIGFLLVRHPVGAFVGGVLGHALDERWRRRGASRAYGPQQQAQWLDGAFAIMGCVAKSDGRVSEDEISAARSAMQMLRLDESQRQSAIAAYTRGKAPEFDLEAVIQRVAGLCRGRPDLRSMFLQLQLLAALAGNDLRGRPREILQKTAAGLGVSGLEFVRMEASARLFHHHATGGSRGGAGHGGAGGSANGAGNGAGNSSGNGFGGGSGGARRTTTLSPAERLAAAYATLGVEATEDDAAVTRAYRRQMSQNHPDKLAASGLPPAMMEVAKEKTQRVREAWEIIRDARGLR